MENGLTDFRIYITLISLLFGIWQFWQKRKIKQILVLEAVELHKNISQALGAIQNAKEAIRNNKYPANEVGIVEGYNQAMLHESAKLFCNLQNTTLDDIDDMINNHQLIEDYKNIYYSFSSGKKGFLRKIVSCIKRIY